MDDTSTGIWAGIAALITAAAAAAVKLLRPYLEYLGRKAARQEARKSNKIFDQLSLLFEARANIRSALRSAISKTIATRVLVLRCENGGGIPSAGHNIYTTIIEEESTAGTNPVKQDWQKRMVSPWYEEHVIAHLIQDGISKLHTKDIPDDEPLRGVYEVQNVVQSYVFPVGATPEKMFVYVSIGWGSDDEPGPLDLYAWNSLVATLGRAYREDQNLLLWQNTSDVIEQFRQQFDL